MESKQEKTICELFAGVGGFRLGFERLNSGWETVWFSQWEPGQKAQWAHDCYIQRFDDCLDLHEEYHTNDDISVVNKSHIPNHTLLVGGFPCQDYSVAQSLSTSKGIEGKKGVLWWQIHDIIKAKRPLFCIFENVDRLISSPAKQRGRDFGIILACLYASGYSVEWRVVNAAKYGGAQKRRRTFIFAYRDDSDYGIRMDTMDPYEVISSEGFMAKSFPILKTHGFFKQIPISDDILEVSNNFTFNFDNAGYMHLGMISTTKVLEATEKPIKLGDILESNVDEGYYLSDQHIEKFKYLKGKKSIPRVSKTGFKYVFSEGSIPFPDSLEEPGRTILTSESNVSRSTHVVRDPETKKLRILTPVETERLQGFDDNWTDTGMPRKTRYYCMGNALVVPMVTRMGKTLDDIMMDEKKKQVKSFLYDYQMDAVNNMKNGCILNGGVGSGKSRTALYYYFKEQGGSINPDYIPMKNPKNLYIITTARKRDTLEWEQELTHFLLSTYEDKNELYNNKIVVDSWNNIQKYADVKDAFFIFDEQRVVGYGAWTKSFLKIARGNDWILLSATPGDTWSDYIPVFIANGFYRNKTEFCREHIVYSRFSKYPKIDRYVGTGKLIKLRNSILIDMVKSAVAGFRQLKQLVKSDSVHGDEDFIDIVLRQFEVPSDDSSLMKKILPSCLSVREKFNIHMAFQWVLKKFLKKDGILIGSKTIAAMIGLKEEPFMEKIKPKLHDCHYRGLFAFGDDTFWRSKVFAVLANLTGNDGSMPLSHYCTKLDGVEDEDCATCIKCGEKYTELLAYEDRSPTAKAYPVHYKCSIEVEEGQSLFFDSEYLVKESN